MVPTVPLTDDSPPAATELQRHRSSLDTMDSQPSILLEADEGSADRRAAFVAALRNGDARAAADVYQPDAWLLAPSTELIAGRPAIEAYWGAGIATGVRTVDLTVLELERRDGLIFEVGRYMFDLDSPDDGAVVERGKYVVVHQQAPGSEWAWAVQLFSPDLEATRRGGAMNTGNREGGLR